MKDNILAINPLSFWQSIEPAGTYNRNPINGHQHFYPAQLPDGRQMILPLRERNGGTEALASLIITQASFMVLDALSSELSRLCQPYSPTVVVGVPTLGLPLAQETAKRLGHDRYVALGTSKKFWYDEALSVNLSSVTSPDQDKRLYIDPRMVPLLKQQTVLLIDDVISTGTSISAACELLQKCDITPSVIGCAMIQTDRWRTTLNTQYKDLERRVIAVVKTPLLRPNAHGRWEEIDNH